MYASVRNRPHAPAATKPEGRRRRVGATVFLLGAVSLLTDVAQEMVTAALPLYLTLQLGLSPLAFGAIDGLYQGATAAVRLLGALVADRRQRHKEVAAVGYAASALCKLGLAVAGGWLAISAVLMVDRLGKGIRTAPRDAMISMSADRDSLGLAFGVHRAMDTVGAMLGPIAAFAILAAAPHAYRELFLVAFLIALVGLAILVLFVRNPVRAEREAPATTDAVPTPAPQASLRSALALLRVPRFRAIVVAGGVLALLTISDAFVYLVLQRRADLAVEWFPLLFLGTAMTYLALAVPIGHLADRVGRGRVFVAGHVALVAAYGLLASAPLGTPLVLVILALMGTYYAATDGVLVALASSTVPDRLRASGLALVSTATASARFASSLLFGAVWVAWDAQGAVYAFLAALAIALPVVAVVLRPRPESLAT